MASTGISGLAVAFAAGGGILVYAGLKDLSPVGALRQIAGGKPEPVRDTGVQLGSVVGDTVSGGSVGTAAGGAAVSGGVLAAAQKYAGDRYSQLKRTQPGWSDCSSFVDKILTDLGIPTPVKWANTTNYLISPEWKTIPLAQARPGDIAIRVGHMALVTGNGGSSAIGQQNPGVNVRTGTVRQLLGPTFQIKRYVGKR